MQLKVFKTLWGFDGEYKKACHQAEQAKFNGIEGPAPTSLNDLQNFKNNLVDSELDFIAEITTAGSYVPDRHASVKDHLDSLQYKMELSLELDPLFITCLGGCDAWPESLSIEFFVKAMELAERYHTDICFETHRGRSLFNPWTTQRIVEKLPEIKLTADFSHWCVVCERLMDSELEIIHDIANNIHHIHARVGYDQGPQVPNPAAPEYEYALRAHQNWWQIAWDSQSNRGYQTTTLTPEFGPDGYLHLTPFSQKPVADLWEINQWMAREEMKHFHSYMPK